MLALQGIGKTYALRGGAVVTALRDVDLTVEAGEFLVITGRSGAGKTTLLNVVGGLTKPSAGSALFRDMDLWSLADVERSRLRNRAMGFVFQFPSLLPALSVLQNVTLPLALGREHVADAAVRATELLDTVGLGDRLQALPRQLSAGQQQRVVIARALVNQPDLLLADEPCSNLDEETEDEIMSLLGRIHAETDITIVLVTHSGQRVMHGTRLLQMAQGELQVTAIAKG